MSQPGTFDRVYAALKQRLRTGKIRPGERLEPAILSDELNASVTPVRDALHRLTGERLVEAPRHEGFRAPLLTEAMLRHVYAWHLDILLIAVARHPPPDVIDAGESLPHHELDAHFASVAAASGNPEHLAALRSVAERLEPYRQMEDQLLDALEEETQAIVGAIRARDRPALRKALLRYHRRRQRIVPELLERIQDPGPD